MKKFAFWVIARLLRWLWSKQLPTVPGVYLHSCVTTQVLDVWRSDEGGLLATRSGRPVAMAVEQWAGSWIGPLPFGASDLRSPKIAPEAFERLADSDTRGARVPASRGLWLLQQSCSRPQPSPSAGSNRDRLSASCSSAGSGSVDRVGRKGEGGAS